MESFKFKTIAAPTTGDFRDRGSKFHAFTFPITSTNDVKERLQELKKEHPKAVHHCYAFRLGTDGTQFRANDDGEPSGSAGKPILGQIDSYGFTDVLVVVVRYFGGTLLGVPGLINAYKTATSLALQTAVTLEKWIVEQYSIEFDYPVMNEVLYLLKQYETQIYQQDLQLFCVMHIGIPKKFLADCLKKLQEFRSLRLIHKTNP
jgi:uncharacterized YigZ family protein